MKETKFFMMVALILTIILIVVSANNVIYWSNQIEKSENELREWYESGCDISPYTIEGNLLTVNWTKLVICG